MSINVARWTTPAAFFPWPYVQHHIHQIEWLVYDVAMQTAREQFAEQARPCPVCGRAPERLFWCSIADPEEAWARGEGRDGFLTICPDCKTQVDFLVEDELTAIQAEQYRETGTLAFDPGPNS
jgi:hypothetical protein